MTVLKTERLLLQELNLNDGAFFLELVNTPGWLKHIGDRNIHSIEAAKEYIQKKLLGSYAENGFGFYKMVLKKEGTTIGICGLIKRPHLEHVDIGYGILPAYERKGYTYEAAAGVMHYADSVLELKTIMGIVSEGNNASKSLLEKIGLKFIGTTEHEGEEGVLLYSNGKDIGKK